MKELIIQEILNLYPGRYILSEQRFRIDCSPIFFELFKKSISKEFENGFMIGKPLKDVEFALYCLPEVGTLTFEKTLEQGYKITKI